MKNYTFYYRILFVINLILTSVISGAQDILRSSTYSFYGGSHGNSIQQTADSGYIVCGTTVVDGN